MSELIFSDASVIISTKDISDHVKSATLNYAAEMQDNTAMGDDTKSSFGGLKTWSLEVEIKQDFAASDIDSILFPLVGTAFTVALRPTSAVVSATNPSYTGTGILESYPPLGGSVGDLATTSITIQCAGTLSRAVS